jgi:hypothetical protein
MYQQQPPAPEPKSKGPRQASKHFPVGTIMKGEDGRDWYVHQCPNGSTRWQKCKQPPPLPPAQHRPPQQQQQQQPIYQQQPPPPPPPQQQAYQQQIYQQQPPPSKQFAFQPQQSLPSFHFQTNPYQQQQQQQTPNPFQTTSSAFVQPASQFTAGPAFYADLLHSQSPQPRATPLLPPLILQPSGFVTTDSSTVMQVEH